MNYLLVLLAANFWQQLGKMEWVYFGVGIATVVALVVTIVFAVLNRKKLQNTDGKAVDKKKTVEASKAADEKPAAAVAQPVYEVVEPFVEPQPATEAKPQQPQPQPVMVVVEQPVQQPVTQSHIPDEIKKLPHKEVLHRGLMEISYDKSQTAKLMQADELVKDYYDLVKNELLSYKGVKCRLSWKHESFTKGRVLLAKLKVRGKHLRLLLPLDPNDYVDTKYKVKDLSVKKNHADTPCGYSIKNNRRCLYANDLIATVMQNNGIEKGEPKEFVKYSKDFPYDTTENLIYRKLIKLTYTREVTGGDMDETHLYIPVQSVAAEDVQRLMSDKEAQESVVESARIADRTKTGIINVDVLSKTFDAGEKVTLAEIKKRVPGFSKKVTYVKVLARGVIDKPLTVEADDYSIDAVKMILLMGGKVIRTRKN